MAMAKAKVTNEVAARARIIGKPKLKKEPRYNLPQTEPEQAKARTLCKNN